MRAAGSPFSTSLPANKIAGSEEEIDAAFVGPQPFMEVGFGRQNKCARAWARIAPLRDHMVERALPACLASLAVRDEIIGWTQYLEIVQVIQHRNVAPLEFPENRRRQMVIDSADMTQVRGKISPCNRAWRAGRIGE